MNKKKPLVSVIIPAYNRADTLSRTINSVLSQTYKNIEIIVIDDGSTDDTKKIVKKFGRKVNYFYKENGGCASALNFGVRNSKGKLISWLSSDDYYGKKMIEKSVALHLLKPGLGMTYTRYYIYTKKAKKPYPSYQPTGRKDALRQCFEICYINGSSIMLKKEVFYNIGFFNENFKYAQDYEFYFRVLGKYDIELIEDYLLHYIDHTGEEDPDWLGYNIVKGTHSNESHIVLERFKLMFEKSRPTVCAMLCIKNEEELIDQCLNDLTMYVDKIVIFDDGSTDDTFNLVKKWGKVEYILRQKPKGNIRTEGADRNKLLQLAYLTDCDYFLFIDTDEIFEDIYKTEIFKEMKNPDVNLWFYHEVNFWRSNEYHRIDTLYNVGWFGRLFKKFPGLTIQNLDEHCCGIPNNIPDTNPWFQNQKTQRKSNVRVKHYGFSTEKRILTKFRNLWERDKIPFNERFEKYGRLIDEKNLILKQFHPIKYYIDEEIKEEEISGKEFGKSFALSKELKNILKIPEEETKDEDKEKEDKKNERAFVKSFKAGKGTEKEEETKEKDYLIIGNGNCFRSQYIQALLKGKGMNAESCGLYPAMVIHPEVIKIFENRGINLKYLTVPINVTQVDVNSFKHIISLVDISNLKIKKKILQWDISDGNIDDLDKIKEILDLTEKKIKELK